MIKNFILRIFMIAGCLLSGCSGDSDTPCPDTNCADYSTQLAAQNAYDADPQCRGDLDADNDGKACEQFFSGTGTSGCPTTANCGCSGKTKSACSGPCCQWIVGDGCKCS